MLFHAKNQNSKKSLQSRKRIQVSAKKFIHPTEQQQASTTQSTKKHNSQGKIKQKFKIEKQLCKMFKNNFFNYKKQAQTLADNFVVSFNYKT